MWQDPLTYDHASHYSGACPEALRGNIHGNVKELVQDHPQLGTDQGGANDRYKLLQYRYDLISGNVLQVSYQDGKADQFHHRYTYDADNRIEAVETSRNNLTWREDARYFYYPHGPLQRVELGDAKVQGLDYAYTLQGWLKGINSNKLTPETDMGRDALAGIGMTNALIGRDAYGTSLNYYGEEDYDAIDANVNGRWHANNNGERPFAPIGTAGTIYTEQKKLYNGNIASTVNTLAPFGGYPNSTVAPGQGLAMLYTYDQLNRLKKARGQAGIGMDNLWANVAPSNVDYYRSQYDYDPGYYHVSPGILCPVNRTLWLKGLERPLDR